MMIMIMMTILYPSLCKRLCDTFHMLQIKHNGMPILSFISLLFLLIDISRVLFVFYSIGSAAMEWANWCFSLLLTFQIKSNTHTTCTVWFDQRFHLFSMCVCCHECFFVVRVTRFMFNFVDFFLVRAKTSISKSEANMEFNCCFWHCKAGFELYSSV